MKSSTPFLAVALLATLGNSAMAVEAEQSSTWMPPSTPSRAEGVAETQARMRIGTLQHNEASFTVVAPSSPYTLPRTLVMAEAREAQRLGLSATNEAEVPLGTVAQREPARLAGLRAVSADSPLASR